MESIIPKTPRQLIILVRHCERADDPSIPTEIKKLQNDIILEYDPQLSRPTGKEQAIKTANFIKTKLSSDQYNVDIENAEIFLFSSPFLACIETASALAKQFKCKSISIQDQLADMLMKNWYSEDPFIGLTTKLTNNKEKFTQFLRMQYDVPEMVLDYKRSTNTVSYPETIDTTSKRFRSFYKTIVEKYFPDSLRNNMENSRIVLCVTHGVPAHNPFLHMFEADKDCCYMDYGAVTIVEKVAKAGSIAPTEKSSPAKDGQQQITGMAVKKEDNPQDYMNQVGAWEIRQFADASHLPPLGIAML